MLDALFLGALTALVLIAVVILAIIISPFGNSDDEDIDEEISIDKDKDNYAD